MFFRKKRQEDDDDFGEQLARRELARREKQNRETGKEDKGSIFLRLFAGGCDTDFVYHDDK